MVGIHRRDAHCLDASARQQRRRTSHPDRDFPHTYRADRDVLARFPAAMWRQWDPGGGMAGPRAAAAGNDVSVQYSIERPG